MREGQGCTLCKKDRDLVFQCGVGGEETKVLNYLSDSKFLVRICGDSKEDYPFVFIPFVTGEAKKLEGDFLPYHVVWGGRQYAVFPGSYNDFECGPKIPFRCRRGK